MFVGHLQDHNAPLPAQIAAAIQHLRETDYSNMEPGKYPIDGEQMFALVQDPLTQDWSTGFPEFHRRYADVQYLLSGEEAIAYLPPTPQAEIRDNFLAERDIAFVQPQENETRIVLTPGMFAVFYPGELHRPCRAVSKLMRIKKVVIKIEIK
ncbi:MAG: YhcH/YjgK/YiaL family protein [Burkholderiales bacterium]|nr:YhcH/YjgK/YiaL family protein [Burkholderiales bacterium]